MKGSIERVRAVVRGEEPDRPGLYELIRNDRVITHFAGEEPTPANAARVVYRAYEPAVDATRPLVRLPERVREEVLPDGRRRTYARWTVWTEHVRFPDSAAYVAAKRKIIDAWSDAWDDGRQRELDEWLVGLAEQRARLGEVFFFPGAPGMGLMGIIGEVGLESFSYFQADAPGLIEELLEIATRESVQWIGHLPAGHGVDAVFCGDDIAFKSGPLLAPGWFEKHYFSRLARVCSAYHEKGIKVLFHSDGNLMPVLAGLVDAGIDGLNPIEVLAGMDVAAIHRAYPRIFMAGGIDASQLLPLGSPAAVKGAVRRALDAAEGRILIGSSTELDSSVPLANFLAMREAVLCPT